MLATGRKLTLGCAALLCLVTVTACGGDGDSEKSSANKPAPTAPSSKPKPDPPKPQGPILTVKNPAQSYTAQIVSSKLSYQRPDGTPMETGRVYLKVLMVVKSADKNRPIKAPGSLQMEVRIPSWGDSPPVLEPATQYYTVDNVDAQGNGIGAGVRATLGTLNADTPYYVTFGAQLEEGDDPSGDKLCGYVEDSPECIQLGKVSPAS